MTDIKHKILQPPARIGIIGGGQLGKMITAEAKRMGYYVIILDPSPLSPAGQMADEQITASFTDKLAIDKLVSDSDVTTFEFEHIDADKLIQLESEGYNIYPSGKSLKIIQDKFLQKTMIRKAGLPVPDFYPVTDERDILNYIEIIGLPFVLKTRSGGYDGKGNCVVKSIDEIGKAVRELKGNSLMIEKFIEFEKELSIIVARNCKKECVYYPVVENLHEDNILRLTRAPSSIDKNIEQRIRDIATRLMDVIDDYGVFCIEMFLTTNGEIYINEIAPRPHNSGHYTIEACVTSQYEQLVRIITGMPMGSTKQRYPSVMVNILGNAINEGKYCIDGIAEVLVEDDIHLHLYGKQHTKNMKKLGHITVVDETLELAEKRALKALEKIKIKLLQEIKL